MKVFLFTLLLGILMPNLAITQANRIYVRDCNDSTDVIVGAIVTTLDRHKGWASDSTGSLLLPSDMKGQLLLVQFPGFKSDTIVYQISKDICLTANTAVEVRIEEVSSGRKIHALNPQIFEQINEKELRKAACCNLSESFETNASVDATYSDGVSGLRQIRLLGLDGKYIPLSMDNVPFIRGVGAARAASLLAGPWIKDISIAKGMGSVMNGFESIAGLINIQTKTSGVQLNQFANSMGRFESNLVLNEPIGKTWQMHVLGHAATQRFEPDMNGDQFSDTPKSNGRALRVQVQHEGSKDPWRADFAVSLLGQQSNAGYIGKDQYWRYFEKFESVGVSGKLGYVFKGNRNRSIGSQVWNWNTVFQPSFMNRVITSQGISSGANMIYASDINKLIRFMAGATLLHERVAENMGVYENTRNEKRIGGFAEYTFGMDTKWLINAGVRIDKSNYFGWILSPRLHGRLTLNPKHTWKFSFGQGNRAANILSDQASVFASNRQLSVQLANKPLLETAWGLGTGWIYKTKLLYRPLSVQADGNITYFTNQLVYDQEKPGALTIYQQAGNGRSLVGQVQIDWSPVKRLDISLSYRKMRVLSGFHEGLLPNLLTPLSRGLMTVSWSSRAFRENWVFSADAVLRLVGSQRLANRSFGDVANSYSSKYQTINLQAAVRYKSRFEFYLGAENVTNFMVRQIIREGNNVVSPYFDASQVWGPVMGRVFYTGLRVDWK